MSIRVGPVRLILMRREVAFRIVAVDLAGIPSGITVGAEIGILEAALQQQHDVGRPAQCRQLDADALPVGGKR